MDQRPSNNRTRRFVGQAAKNDVQLLAFQLPGARQASTAPFRRAWLTEQLSLTQLACTRLSAGREQRRGDAFLGSCREVVRGAPSRSARL